MGVSALSAGAYTATLYVMVDIVRGGGHAPTPHPHQGWADFSIMMECTPESGYCESSVYNVLVSNSLLRISGCFSIKVCNLTEINHDISRHLYELLVG